jgi:hypothetical protein
MIPDQISRIYLTGFNANGILPACISILKNCGKSALTEVKTIIFAGN